MKYAIVTIGGTQHKISEGAHLSVNNLNQEVGKKLTFNEVHLVVNDGKVSLGNPVVKKATIQATVVENYKDDKVRVAKFKAKSRYRVVNGFRAMKTKLLVNQING